MPPATETETSCVACGRPGAGARCGHCGVPTEPGGFRVQKVIATTAHSRMLLAEKSFERVALKELLFALVPTAEQLSAFEREARLLKQLDHPRIPKFVASFQEGEGAGLRLYLAQEYLPGGSLLEELEHKRFSEQDAKDVARQVLGILAYLHGLSPRVIHRDVKPANLMRGKDGQLMLVDFGAARDLLKGVTHGATLVGTFGYMPPEQLGGTVDETADLYALGASLIHLLARRPPEELLMAEPRPDPALAMNVSAPFADWLTRLTARERSRRFPTARAALAALDERPAESGSRGPAMPKAAMLIGVMAAILVAGGVTAFVLTGPVRSQPVAVAFPVPPPHAPPGPVSAGAAPSRASGPLVPKPLRPRPPAPVETPKVDVAEVIELEPSQPRRALLRDDATFTLGTKLTAATGCPTPPIVEFVSAQLQAEGGGSLEKPKSKLSLTLAMTNSGGIDAACTRATVFLRSLSGETLGTYSLENQRPGTTVRREADLSFPRTLTSVKLCVEGECAKPLDLARK